VCVKYMFHGTHSTLDSFVLFKTFLHTYTHNHHHTTIVFRDYVRAFLTIGSSVLLSANIVLAFSRSSRVLVYNSP
jgi:hypothetical protein